MNSKLIFSETKIALKETSKYILSHHQPNEYYKCYSLSVLNQKIYICSRCFGIYVGILTGIIIFNPVIQNLRYYYLLIAVLPIFTLIDWSISAFKIYRSHNIVRTGSGVLLGISYSSGLIILFKSFPNYYIIGIGLVYTLIALFLLQKQREMNCK
ncbi:DUF2085 domain-containing protein [uncultured Methanomethylovorans sp.]|uniref:DUF2085 domain-containing protein n=1 Tax=uncultured Methanomethylovorans sp. TaxID=183759 RepID=UPI0037499D89